MSWQDDKDLGPWDFTEQPDKWGYLNNPRWTDVPGPPVDYTGREDEEPQIWTPDGGGQFVSGSPNHKPCGHWHKISEAPIPDIVDADIFVLHGSGYPTIMGVHFDGSRLTYVGYYGAGADINGLILLDDILVTVSGNEATARLETVTTYVVDGKFLLIHSHNIFNQYDILYSIDSGLTSAGNSFYYLDRSGICVRIGNNFLKEARGFRKTVTTGTDGKLYRAKNKSTQWQAVYRPITGGAWSNVWTYIPDQICYSPIIEWDTAPINTDSSARIDAVYHKGSLYSVDYSSPSAPIRKINPSSMEIDKIYKGSSLIRITAKDNRIFACGGVTGATIYAFDLDLSFLGSTVLPSGRIFGDIEIVGNYLIMSTTESGVGSPGALYKINPDTLNILDSVEDSQTQLWRRLIKINDQFVAVGRNTGMCVFDITTMTLVDDLDSPSQEYPIGYGSQAMAIKYN